MRWCRVQPNEIARRPLLLGTGSWLALIASACSEGATTRKTAEIEASLAPEAPVLYYLNAMDCKWCVFWDEKFRPEFELSPIRSKLRFVTISTPHMRVGIFYDYLWPNNLLWVRDSLKAHNAPNAWPIFVLVHQNKYIGHYAGADERYAFGWSPKFFAKLKKEVDLE